MALYSMNLPPQILQRGFWVYVWKIKDANNTDWIYVGRTGDNSSPYAAAPYQRLGQHLGQQANVNALRARLLAQGINADECQSFEMLSFGPFLPEVKHTEGFAYNDRQERAALFELHKPFRNVAANLERDLYQAFLHSSLHEQLLNIVGCKMLVPEDMQQQYENIRAEMLQSFVEHFPELGEAN